MNEDSWGVTGFGRRKSREQRKNMEREERGGYPFGSKKEKHQLKESVANERGKAERIVTNIALKLRRRWEKEVHPKAGKRRCLNRPSWK